MNPMKPFCTVKKQTNKQRKLTYVSRFGLLLMMRMTIRYRGSISVSEELRTYPSPNPTLTLTCYHFTVFRLREEQVRSCSDSDIDLIALCQDSQNVCSIDTINHSTIILTSIKGSCSSLQYFKRHGGNYVGLPRNHSSTFHG